MPSGPNDDWYMAGKDTRMTKHSQNGVCHDPQLMCPAWKSTDSCLVHIAKEVSLFSSNMQIGVQRSSLKMVAVMSP